LAFGQPQVYYDVPYVENSYFGAPVITINYSPPVDNPWIVLDGMNDDDFYTVDINGSYYPLNATSSTLGPELDAYLSGLYNDPGSMIYTARW